MICLFEYRHLFIAVDCRTLQMLAGISEAALQNMDSEDGALEVRVHHHDNYERGFSSPKFKPKSLLHSDALVVPSAARRDERHSSREPDLLGRHDVRAYHRRRRRSRLNRRGFFPGHQCDARSCLPRICRMVVFRRVDRNDRLLSCSTGTFGGPRHALRVQSDPILAGEHLACTCGKLCRGEARRHAFHLE